MLYTVLYIYVANIYVQDCAEHKTRLLLIETFFRIAIFSTLTLHCWFAQQSRVSLTWENITKTHAIDIHTLLDGELRSTLVASGDVAAASDDVWWHNRNQVASHFIGVCFHPNSYHSVFEGQGLGVRRREGVRQRNGIHPLTSHM